MPNYPAFEILNPNGKTPVLLVCDHASNTVPDSVNGGTLGLPDHDMERHIAYDVGARGVTEHLTELLDAHAIVSRFSRLVIDPNRGEDDPTILMKLYDGSIIPGNRYADDAEKERRIAQFHRPYHEALHRQIDMMVAEGRTPALVSIHSFTKELKNRPLRPWHLGVLWAHDGRLASPDRHDGSRGSHARTGLHPLVHQAVEKPPTPPLAFGRVVGPRWSSCQTLHGILRQG